jgi:prepilin-type N-terminal cleavage/methylation domain-containing protein
MAKRGGFTLLEVILVTTLMAMIAGFSVGVYRNYGKGIELNAVKKNVIYDLRQMQVRASAGENRRNWGAHFVNGAQDYYEVFSSPTNYADVGKTIINIVYLPSTVIFTKPAEGVNFDMIFSSILGSANADFITVSSEGNGQTVNVTASGAVY